MSYTFDQRTFTDVQDAILMALATSHPQLSFSREDHLKRELLEIMVDDAGWLDRPSCMREQFETAMGGLAAHRWVCAAE